MEHIDRKPLFSDLIVGGKYLGLLFHSNIHTSSEGLEAHYKEPQMPVGRGNRCWMAKKIANDSKHMCVHTILACFYRL